MPRQFVDIHQYEIITAAATDDSEASTDEMLKKNDEL
jgi:hypothetical protein